mmetsp:Transcript_4840/g.6607  ORF Transcript_4840/g.6607 Transcript_4840/m.6607 type:complete len:164 (-) Transcript_4840:75-566(-)
MQEMQSAGDMKLNYTQKAGSDMISRRCLSWASWIKDESDRDSSECSNDTEDNISRSAQPPESNSYDNNAAEDVGIEELIMSLPQISFKDQVKERKEVLTEFGWVEFPSPSSSCRSFMSSVNMMSSPCLLSLHDLGVEDKEDNDESSKHLPRAPLDRSWFRLQY